MPYYTDSNGTIYFLESADHIGLLPKDVKKISDSKVAELLKPTDDQLWQNYQAQARALLVKSDAVAIRCIKAGVTYPTNWCKFDSDLRAIINALTGDSSMPLPTMPEFPKGS